jgi:hypothetical protein
VGRSLRVPAASARSVPRTRTFRSVRGCVPATGTFRRLVQERLGRDAGAGQARGRGRVRAGGHSDPVHHRRHGRQGSRLGRGWVELFGRLRSSGGSRLRRRAHKARRPPVLRSPEGPEWAKNGAPVEAGEKMGEVSILLGRSRREGGGTSSRTCTWAGTREVGPATLVPLPPAGPCTLFLCCVGSVRMPGRCVRRRGWCKLGIKNESRKERRLPRAAVKRVTPEG